MGKAVPGASSWLVLYVQNQLWYVFGITVLLEHLIVSKIQLHWKVYSSWQGSWPLMQHTPKMLGQRELYHWVTSHFLLHTVIFLELKKLLQFYTQNLCNSCCKKVSNSLWSAVWFSLMMHQTISVGDGSGLEAGQSSTQTLFMKSDWYCSPEIHMEFLGRDCLNGSICPSSCPMQVCINYAFNPPNAMGSVAHTIPSNLFFLSLECRIWR